MQLVSGTGGTKTGNTGSKETTLREVAPGSRREPRVSLVFYFREGAKIVVPGPEPLVVGRTWPADIVVDDPSVSRTHARFFVAADGGVVFEDLGSTNGTRLNGAPTPRGRIAPGDEVRVGDVSVALHVLSTVAGVQGLLGYDLFLRLLDDELVRARTFMRPVSLLMIGARAPGHPLRTWVPALLEQLRPVDRAAVYAADAVLVALPETTRALADALGATLVAADPALRFGAATFPDAGATVDELLDAARTAMVQGAGAPASATPSSPASPKMREVWDMIDRVAPSVLPVLVQGETGTGKEVVARALHARSTRKDGPLRSVNCAAIPSNLVESVLFGHEKGAFTGAERTTKGLFEQAHGGTLMLDEVGELPAAAQAALLRVLETKQLVRVGGDRELSIDVRVVAATHRDLEKMCAENAFRWDLFYRLHGVTIALPALRERTEEIRPLAESFLRDACRDNARTVRAIDDVAMSALLQWHWPGNVRELKNVVERAVVIARSDVVTLDDLPERLRPPSSASALAPALASPPAPAPASDLDYKERLRLEMQRYETTLIADALTRANGNVTAAAQALKIPVRTLTHKMQALGIKKRIDPA
ncbi:MAG: two component, sigma54 specific, transcriptional regulator, Fis family [Myxococcaceae bacterium]|nr:two component, sigma54 specific, transcriptional regulator, Fis family [Myxococcaceae bacterium]